jgi:ATP-binding cassette subfamily F protein 3
MKKNKKDQVVATSQVSRFHSETVESLSKDVDLKGVNITVGDRELLADTDLRIFNGVHYGLVGQNGVGKSTLLKCIGKKTLIGLPSNINALYVEQLEGVDTSRRTLDVVVDSDNETAQLRRKFDLLTGALESGDSKRLVASLKEIEVEEVKLRHKDAEDKATKRSGARGATARRHLNEMEELVKATEKATINESDAAVKCQEKLLEVQEELELRDADSLESRARTILNGLGFSESMVDGPISNLSGGWKIRVSLASALLINPDVLLLDEPTNHLDLPAIIWLQGYLQSLDSSVVVISHDRALLNAVTEETIVLKDGKLSYFTGNYDEYREHFEERQHFLRNKKEHLEKQKANAEKAAEKEMVKARKSGDDKKMAAMASKQRKLKNSVQMDANEKGHRFKLNRDRPGYHHNARPDIVLESIETPPKWSLENPVPLRNSGSLITFDQVSFKYSTAPILKDITLNVPQNARIGLVGANGQGKSTILKLITELNPTFGTIQRQGTIGYFSQHQVDDLLNLDESPITLLNTPEQTARAQLGKFGIKGTTSMSPLNTLSGGQLARVAFAKMAMTSPHLLILDEPTNHLDFLTIEALITCLQNFKGAIIIASHDQHFISQTCQEIYLVKNTKLKRLENVQRYVTSLKSS